MTRSFFLLLMLWVTAAQAQKTIAIKCGKLLDARSGVVYKNMK